MQKLSLLIATFFISTVLFAQKKKEYQFPEKLKTDTSAITKLYKQIKPYKLKIVSPKKNNYPADKLAKINSGNMPVVILSDKGLAPMPNFYDRKKDICVQMPNIFNPQETTQNK